MKPEPPGEQPPEDLEIAVEDAPPPPEGAPPNFRERLVLHLRTTNPAALERAERDFRGVFASVDDFVCTQLAAQVPDWLPWLREHVSPDELREGYEAGTRQLWTIPLSDGRVMVFESEPATSNSRGRWR